MVAYRRGQTVDGLEGIRTVDGRDDGNASGRDGGSSNGGTNGTPVDGRPFVMVGCAPRIL